MRKLATTILCVFLIAGCATSQRAETIQISDALRVVISGIPDPQTHTCTVDHVGKITLPLIGAVSVVGKTSSEIEVAIKKAYSRDWITSFTVSVTRMKQE